MQACSGCVTLNPLGDLCGIPPPCCPSWLSHDTSWERGESESVPGRQLWAPGSSCARRGTLLSKHCVPVCLRKTEPQPVIDVSVVTMWRRWNVPSLTPLRRKVGSRHIKRVQKQLRYTLIRRVAGPVERILNSLIHQRNGLMWSNPRVSTEEAAAMRPRSLRQVLTETWWTSLKRAKHALKLEIWAGAWRACIWTESKWTPKNPVCRVVVRTLFLVFVLRPSSEAKCGGGRYLCDNSLTPWSRLVWGNHSGSWVHECPGASKGPEQHPCTLWTSSTPRPGQREEPCTDKPFLQK